MAYFALVAEQLYNFSIIQRKSTSKIGPKYWPTVDLLSANSGSSLQVSHQMLEKCDLLQDGQNKHFHVRNSKARWVNFGQVQHLRGLYSIEFGYLNFTARLT